MKYLVKSFIFMCMLAIKSNCDEYLGQHINWHKKLEDYRLSPVVENCYEIYDQTEKITPFICQRPANYEKHSCIHWISDVDGISGEQEEYCLGLKTPTNETVELICDKTQHEFVSYNEIDLKSCFKVYNIDKIFKTVCQQTFDNFSIGIVTPDNFTVLFGSYFCKTSVSIYNKKVYDNFVNNFSFDPELRSCYKVYKPDQTVSPYTCLNKDVHYSCVHDLPKYKNCVGITTPNNETVILDCSDNSEKLESSGCFKIYTSSNNVHIACQKKLEERCIGITTPSNLTILFECYFCSIPEIRYTRYNIEEQRKHRKFVKSYLTEEYLGRNSYLKNIGFEVFGKNYFIEPPNCDERINSYPYWLPNTDCYALTLNSNETIILECISNDRQAKPGCFKVFSPEKKETTICMEVLGESCLGITTPHNLSVVLTCYPSYTCYTHTDLDIIKNLYAEGTAESFKLYPAIGNCYEVYDEYQEISPDYCKKKSHPENYACIDLIPGKRQCLGLKTPKNETIEFLCSNSTEELLSYNSYINKHCFNIYSPDGRTENICQRKFGNNVIGITTPRNDSILFESYFCRMPKTLDDIKTYREFLRNFIFDPNIRSCYKVYTESQEVSPYTCLNKEVYDACTHPLEDPSCIGITTQNNETVVLHCSNDNRGQDNAGCFKIYTADNIEHSVCQTELEERCIGLITPSNLTMLLECHTCTSPQGESLPSYLDGFRRTHRGFVERALNSYKQDNYSFGDVPLYNVYNPLQEIKENDCFGEISTYFVHLLYGHDNCRGVTLKNFETIVLDCPDKKPDKPGCFNVFSPKYGPNNTIVGPDQQAQNVCVQILNERCVGFITPGNWTIALACNQPRQAACSAINIPNRGSPPRM